LKFNDSDPLEPNDMFLGHYGVAFAAKRMAPRTSLGTLAFATQFLDELWPILLLVGIERARVVPGLMAANPIAFEYYPFSHSLATALVWGVLIGVTYLALRRYPRGAWITGAVVVSHWILDVPMHAADLPLWPGSHTFIGWGAWRSIPLSIALDAGTFLVGLALYLRVSRAANWKGRWGLWTMVVVLLAIFIGSSFGPPPGSVRALAVSALGLWLFVPWAAWIDRHRVLISRGQSR